VLSNHTCVDNLTVLCIVLDSRPDNEAIAGMN